MMMMMMMMSICMKHFYDGTDLPLVPSLNYNYVQHFAYIAKLIEIVATVGTRNEIVNVMGVVFCEVQTRFYVLCFRLHILCFISIFKKGHNMKGFIANFALGTIFLSYKH
jgi:hypothetical protein